MSRFRLLFEGELRDGDDINGVSEQVAVRLEDIADVRLIEVRRELCGCLICKHGNPIPQSFDRKVFCVKDAKPYGAMDCCSRFENFDLKDIMGIPELSRRCDRFNKFYNQLER